MSEADAPGGEGASPDPAPTPKPRIEPIEWERKPHNSWPPQFFRTEQPTYIASALCVLLGMYLTGSGLEAHAWGRVGLAGIMLTYQALLIGGAALLLRVGQRRSALLLSAVAAVFIVDPTLRLEGVVTLEHWGFTLAGLWGALSLLGAYALVRVAGVRLNASAWYAIATSVVMIAAVPVLIRLPEVVRGRVFLAAWWLAGTLLFVAGSARSSSSTLARNPVELGRLNRAIGIAAHIAPLGALGHVFASMNAFDELFGPAHFLPILAVAPLRATTETRAWVYGALTMLVALPQHQTLLPGAALMAIVFLYKGYLLSRPRLFIAATLCLHLAMGAYGHTAGTYHLGATEPWMLWTSIAILLLLALWYRMPLAAVAAGLLWHHGRPPGPDVTVAQWGMLLLCAGFAALIYALARDLKRGNQRLAAPDGGSEPL